MKIKNDEQMIKKSLVFILKINHLSSYEKYLDNLIADQGIEKVFNEFYKLFYFYGDVIAKNKKITDIIQKYNRDR